VSHRLRVKDAVMTPVSNILRGPLNLQSRRFCIQAGLVEPIMNSQLRDGYDISDNLTTTE
jgi:hypothetical protein